MGFDQRAPVALDPSVDPNLPIADSSQPHDIPTGVAPSLAKLQDWIAWLETHKLEAPGNVVTGSLAISNDLVVGDEVQVGGALRFTGTEPASTADPGADSAYATNQCKVWGLITTDGAGNVTVVDGYNIASVAIVAGRIEITFARAFSSANYAPTLTKFNATSGIVVGDDANSTSGKLSVLHFTDAGVAVAPSLSALKFAVDIKGRQ